MVNNRSNSFVENFHQKKLPFSWYLLGSLIIIIFSFLGQIPTMFFLPDQLSSSANQMDVFAHLDSNLTLSLLLIPSFVAFFGFLLVVYRLHQQTIISVTTSREKIDVKRIFFGFVFWGGLSILLFGVDLFLSPKDYQWNFKFLPFLLMFLISSALIPFQSALEEWIFRGYLMQGFATLTKSRLLSLLLTSIIFGSLHILNPEIDKLGYGLLAYYIATGLFFGIMSLMDEGIELAIGFHVANNLITALLVTADWTAFQTESLFKDVSNPSLLPELILFLVFIYPLTLVLLAKKYRWGNWTYKLTARIYDDKT